MPPSYTPGSLVSARGREWVVLPESAPDMLVLRPLGGADDDIAAVFPDFEPVTDAQFAPPSPTDLGDAQAASLLRSALRIGFRSGAGPFRSLAGIAVEPRAYQLVPLLMALRQKTVRMLISDDVGIGKTIEAGLIASEMLAQGERHPAGGALLAGPGRAVAGRAAHQVRPRRRTGAGLHRVQTGTRPGPGAVAVRPAPARDRLHRLHQVHPAPRRLRPALPGPGHRRRGAHLRGRRRQHQQPEPAPLRAAATGRRRPRSAPAAGDRHPAQRQGERLPQPARPAPAGPGRPSTSARRRAAGCWPSTSCTASAPTCGSISPEATAWPTTASPSRPPSRPTGSSRTRRTGSRPATGRCWTTPSRTPASG